MPSHCSISGCNRPADSVLIVIRDLAGRLHTGFALNPSSPNAVSGWLCRPHLIAARRLAQANGADEGWSC